MILDHIGARYLPRDLEALAIGGRIVIIGSMGGERTAEIDVVQAPRQTRADHRLDAARARRRREGGDRRARSSNASAPTSKRAASGP